MSRSVALADPIPSSSFELLLGAKLNVEPKTLASVAAGRLLRGGRRIRCRYEAQANRIRVKEHYEREQEARKAARKDRKAWVDPSEDAIQTISADGLKQHPDFKIAKDVAGGFKRKYRNSNYDDLLQKANVVLLDEKEYFPTGHESRPVSIEKKITRRLSPHCIEESRSRQIFEQPPEQPRGDESEGWNDWADCAAARWSPRPERARRVTAVLRTGELTQKEWQIWKLLAAGKTHVAIASALGLSSHDVVYHAKEKIKVLLRRQPDEPAASPPASSNSRIIPMSVPLPWVNAEVARYRNALRCFKKSRRAFGRVSHLMFGKPDGISLFNVAIGRWALPRRWQGAY